jgi:hypothetical protein
VPEVNLQWKGMQVCLDFQCECSSPDSAYEFHADGWSFGRLRCPRCRRVWRLAHTVEVTLDEDQDRPALMLSSDELFSPERTAG